MWLRDFTEWEVRDAVSHGCDSATWNASKKAWYTEYGCVGVSINNDGGVVTVFVPGGSGGCAGSWSEEEEEDVH